LDALLASVKIARIMCENHYRQLLLGVWPALNGDIQRGPFARDELERRTQLFVECLLWLVDSGGAWDAIPERYGNPANIYQRFNRWCRSGRIFKLFEILNTDGAFPYDCDGRKIFNKDHPELFLALSRRHLWKRRIAA
jgi:transposase